MSSYTAIDPMRFFSMQYTLQSFKDSHSSVYQVVRCFCVILLFFEALR